MAGRTCSECGKPLESLSVRARTCSPTCRKERSRRLKRTNQAVEDYTTQHSTVDAVAAIARRDAPEIVTTVVKEQLAPIVREAITEDVERAIAQLVGLTTQAVTAIQEDLQGDDTVLRQRAYTLVVKHTIGHPALVKSDEQAQGQLVVNFNLPRPGVEDFITDDEAPELELRCCDICNTERPDDEFEGGSTRCRACFDSWKERIMERFA